MLSRDPPFAATDFFTAGAPQHDDIAALVFKLEERACVILTVFVLLAASCSDAQDRQIPYAAPPPGKYTRHAT